MDGANILYNLEPLTIDYNKLLQMLYGEDALNSIIVKKCVVFRSTLENKNMQEKQDLYIKKVKTNLEDVGFEVEIVSNYSQKANQIDDNKLIDIIRSYKNKLDRVLIMTGDQHFIPVIEEYRDEGKEVYVTSLEQQNTSSKIVNTAGITHYYINEIQDIIQL